MKIPSISSYLCNTNKAAYQNPKNNRGKTSYQTLSFGVNFTNAELIYKSSIALHQANIIRTNPSRVEEYFRQQGICAFFREGSDFARKMVAYCCYHASEIFSQLHYRKPVQIGITDFSRMGSRATGLAFYVPSTISPTETYPSRTVLFNSFTKSVPYVLDGKIIPLNWENFFLIMADNKKKNFLSSGHFLSPFIHEFAHVLHYDKLFSAYGSPIHDPHYIFNPNMKIILDKLNLKLDNNNPFVSASIVNNIDKNVSCYGTTSLPETFAEAFTKAVLENIDVFSLRLTKNPFPMENNGNKILNQVLYEAFEGLVGDGAGLI